MTMLNPRPASAVPAPNGAIGRGDWTVESADLTLGSNCCLTRHSAYPSACHQGCDPRDIGREHTVFGKMRYLRADELVHCLQSPAGVQRTPVVDTLGCAEQLDGEHALDVACHLLRFQAGGDSHADVIFLIGGSWDRVH